MNRLFLLRPLSLVLLTITEGDVPNIKAWENTPIAAVNGWVDPTNPEDEPRYFYL